MAVAQLVNLGLDNYIPRDRVVAIVKPDTSPIRRLVNELKEDGKVVDISRGRRARSVVLTDAGYVILSSVRVKTLSERFEEG
ncbi:MAG: DUF370 domain-containing protein [Candidatus Bipolaricaulia bacterium]